MKQEISFGKLIKEHRQLLDLTQAELARRAGCAVFWVDFYAPDLLRNPALPFMIEQDMGFRLINHFQYVAFI